MDLKTFQNFAAVCATTFFATGLHADLSPEEERAIYYAGELTEYQAPVAILPDHPQCNGPGNVAFEVSLNVTQINFMISGDDWNGKVKQFSQPDARTQSQTCIIGEPEPDKRSVRQRFRLTEADEICSIDEPRQEVFRDDVICYRTERRGVDEIRIETACTEQNTSSDQVSLNELVRAANISVDVHASAVVCQSITGIGLLESEWRVVAEAGGDVDQFEGSFEPNRWFDPGREGRASVSLQYLTQSSRLMQITDEMRSGHFALDPMRSAGMRLNLTIEDLRIPGASNDLFVLSAERSFSLGTE